MENQVNCIGLYFPMAQSAVSINFHPSLLNVFVMCSYWRIQILRNLQIQGQTEVGHPKKHKLVVESSATKAAGVGIRPSDEDR